MKIFSTETHDSETPKEKSQTNWVAKRIGKWKGAIVWEVSYKGQTIGNAFGSNESEAIKMVRQSHPSLDR